MPQFLVVRSAVEGDRQREARVKAGSRDVEGELADRYAHAAGSLVAEAEDALVVGDHDEPDSGLARVAEQFRNAVDVVRSDPHSPGPAHDVAVLPTGAPNRWRVDDRGELFEVIDQQPVEERLVAVLQCRETDVLLEVVSLSPQMLELEGHLFLDCHGPPRQQAAKSERRPLLLGERGVLVDCGAVEQLTTPRRHRLIRRVNPTRPARTRHLVLPSLACTQITRLSPVPEGPNVTFAQDRCKPGRR